MEFKTLAPYGEKKWDYLIINADSLDHAAELSKKCPIFENDGQVEVREIMDMSM